MKENSKNKFKQIFDLSKMILVNYNGYQEAKINHNELEIKQLKIRIKSLSDIENEMYDNISKEELIAFFENSKNFHSSDDKITTIHNRMFNQARQRLIETGDLEIGNEYKNELPEHLYSICMLISQEINEECVSLNIYLLNSMLKDKRFNSEGPLAVRNLLFYSHPSLEKKYINSDFEIENLIFLSSMVSKRAGLTDAFYNQIANFCCLPILSAKTEKIIELSKRAIDNENITNMYIQLCSIRAYNQKLVKQDVKFLESISIETLEKNDVSSIYISMVKEAYKSYDEDRLKYSIATYGTHTR